MTPGDDVARRPLRGDRLRGRRRPHLERRQIRDDRRLVDYLLALGESREGEMMLRQAQGLRGFLSEVMRISFPTKDPRRPSACLSALVLYFRDENLAFSRNLIQGHKNPGGTQVGLLLRLPQSRDKRRICRGRSIIPPLQYTIVSPRHFVKKVHEQRWTSKKKSINQVSYDKPKVFVDFFLEVEFVRIAMAVRDGEWAARGNKRYEKMRCFVGMRDSEDMMQFGKELVRGLSSPSAWYRPFSRRNFEFLAFRDFFAFFFAIRMVSSSVVEIFERDVSAFLSQSVWYRLPS